MSESIFWTNTENTYVDSAHSNKFVSYKGVEYVAQCLNFRGEIQQHPADFEFEQVSKRIEADISFIGASYDSLKAAMHGAWAHGLGEPATNDTDPSFANVYFTGSDARAAYAITEVHKPKKIIEVGSGNSTKFFRRSIQNNTLTSKITSIDPSPRTSIERIVDETIRKSVGDVDKSIFDTLASGDVLFWDGCHICFNGSDVCTLFLEVLPRLKPGIIVHVHDIYLPYAGTNQHAGVSEEISLYSPSEQLMLATYLLASKGAKVMLPLYYMMKKKVANEAGVSFWFTTG